MITIIAIGKKREDWVMPGIERYQKRLRPPFNIEWALLPHSSLEYDAARKEESDRIRKRLPDGAYVILLDERGKGLSSGGLSAMLSDGAAMSRDTYVVIGGAYGVDDELTGQANFVLSLSAMVFPHQMVRLLLTEQIYRAQEIARGGKYHHE